MSSSPKPDTSRLLEPEPKHPDQRPDGRFMLGGLAKDVWSTEDEATATCICGKVQIVVVSPFYQVELKTQPLKSPGLVAPFVCNCADCRKVCNTMFATNFTVKDKYIRYIRGEDNVTAWGQDVTPATGGTMTNGFCTTCGTLMWRQGSSFPGTKFMRVGTVDDLRLHETVLRPQKEYFVENRAEWLHGVEDAKQITGFFE